MGSKLSDFSFEALGRSMDKDWQDFKMSVGLSNNASDRKKITIGDIVRDLLKRAGQDVTIQAIDSEFEYNDLIKWVRENAIGDKLYVIKAKLENSSDGVLCVFFSKDDALLTGESYPKICYVFKSLNLTLEDLFTDGKYVYVKPIKIV